MSHMSSALFVCTVGGSPAPIIYSLGQQKPDCVLFVCSRGSRSLVEEQIVPALEDPFAFHVFCLSDEQNLSACVREIQEAVAERHRFWNLPMETRLLADFTGGTKVMSAALVLALLDRHVDFTYIGGVLRDKQGLGAVQDGAEKLVHHENPWCFLTSSPVQRLAEAFSAGQFLVAGQGAAEIAAQGLSSTLFSSLAQLCQAYAQWERCDYRHALGFFEQALTGLRGTAPQSLHNFCSHVEQNREILRDVTCELSAHFEQHKPCPKFLADLAANALRREEQGAYDDAVARLYSLLEKVARTTLLCNFGIDTSHVSLDTLPAAFLKEAQPLTGHDGSLQLPLFKAYLLLAHLGHSLGQTFLDSQERLTKVLQARNNSLLAHGFEPVSAATCQELRILVLGFLQIREEHLVRFPRLEGAALVQDLKQKRER